MSWTVTAKKKVQKRVEDLPVPWRELFPEYTDEELPGVCLAGSRLKEGMTQKRLSELTGIPQSHISEMENGKRPIGKKRAKILAKVLNVGYKVFL
jgi:plasmid maintenance system antidote protein VapI